jgi:hypothetical protein
MIDKGWLVAVCLSGTASLDGLASRGELYDVPLDRVQCLPELHTIRASATSGIAPILVAVRPKDIEQIRAKRST